MANRDATPCPNLEHLYGRRYRVTVGPEHRAERGHNRKTGVDPWHYRIESTKEQKAHIFPWSLTRLAVSRDFKSTNAVNQRLLSTVPSAKLEQDGDDGVIISFDVIHFSLVSRIVRLRKRRTFTPEQRQAMAERLRNV